MHPLTSPLLCHIGADERLSSGFSSASIVTAIPETKDEDKGRSLPLPGGNQDCCFHVWAMLLPCMLGACMLQISMAAARDSSVHGMMWGMNGTPTLL